MFLVIDIMIIKFACFIILNLNKDYQNKNFCKVLKEVNYLLLISPTLE